MQPPDIVGHVSNVPPPTASIPLFEGLDAAVLTDILGRLQPRHFAPRMAICREGEPGTSMFILQSGVAQVLIGAAERPVPVARLRRGDVIGEMSLLTGEPRSATVIANVATEVLELSQETFTTLVAHHPALVTNLSRILSRRLAQRSLQQVQSRLGEPVALVVAQSAMALAADVIEATVAASPRKVAVLDLTGSLSEIRGTSNSSYQPRSRLDEPTVASALAVLDDLLADHGTVLVVAASVRGPAAGDSVPTSEGAAKTWRAIPEADLPLLLEHTDRVIVLATEAEVRPLVPLLAPAADRLELALLTAAPDQAPQTVAGLRVVRAIDPAYSGCKADFKSVPRQVAWLGRHLSRTKLGLALGAGGAKGYAHVGALYVLEEAGYTVDYVAGSSIGALVGAWLALGMKAAEIDALMRRSFSPESVAAMFKLSMSGMSAGLEVHARMCRESTGDRTFADLQIPLVAMAVDLTTRQPAPIREGPLWQALLASTALAGLFPPYERGRQRLVDGLALVPVPTGAVREAGADIAVSVNLMNREMLPAWPGQSPPAPSPARSGSRMLETLLEVMDLSQVDSSTRHAALADVAIIPRFGPGSWRDFHLADLFLTAGRSAAEEQLASLRARAQPG
jgi:predicted acylesterase/phospholipase RssA/CRP-like cAMP-binding protein